MALTFTDDDLKRFKGYAAENIGTGRLNWEDLRALLARLKAAENVCGHVRELICPEYILKMLDDWRKAAGK